MKKLRDWLVKKDLEKLSLFTWIAVLIMTFSILFFEVRFVPLLVFDLGLIYIAISLRVLSQYKELIQKGEELFKILCCDWLFVYMNLVLLTQLPITVPTINAKVIIGRIVLFVLTAISSMRISDYVKNSVFTNAEE